MQLQSKRWPIICKRQTISISFKRGDPPYFPLLFCCFLLLQPSTFRRPWPWFSHADTWAILGMSRTWLITSSKCLCIAVDFEGFLASVIQSLVQIDHSTLESWLAEWNSSSHSPVSRARPKSFKQISQRCLGYVLQIFLLPCQNLMMIKAAITENLPGFPSRKAGNHGAHLTFKITLWLAGGGNRRLTNWRTASLISTDSLYWRILKRKMLILFYFIYEGMSIKNCFNNSVSSKVKPGFPVRRVI